MIARVHEGQSVVIVRGRYTNEPAIVVRVNVTKGKYQARTVDVLLGRTGERVTVRMSSLELY